MHGKRTLKMLSRRAVFSRASFLQAVETPIEEGLKEEAYQLGQAMASTPAARRFAFGKEQGIQDDLETQKNWDKGVMDIQSIQ